MIIAELKRGELKEDAVTQALGYASEFAVNTDEVAELFAEYHKESSPGDLTRGLVGKFSSKEDLQRCLKEYVRDNEINAVQIILLLGEEFSARALAICDYLNRSSGEASFSLECWQFAIFEDKDSHRYFVLEQVISPTTTRDIIEEKR